MFVLRERNQLLENSGLSDYKPRKAVETQQLLWYFFLCGNVFGGRILLGVPSFPVFLWAAMSS